MVASMTFDAVCQHAIDVQEQIHLFLDQQPFAPSFSVSLDGSRLHSGPVQANDPSGADWLPIFNREIFSTFGCGPIFGFGRAKF